MELDDKPGSVPEADKRLQAAVIPLGQGFFPASSDLPEDASGLRSAIDRASLKRLPIWSCSGRGLPSLPRHRGNWWALTPPFHPYPAPTLYTVTFLL